MPKLYKFKCSCVHDRVGAVFNTTTEQEAKFEYVKLTGFKLGDVDVINEGPVQYALNKRSE